MRTVISQPASVERTPLPSAEVAGIRWSLEPPQLRTLTLGACDQVDTIPFRPSICIAVENIHRAALFAAGTGSVSRRPCQQVAGFRRGPVDIDQAGGTLAPADEVELAATV